MDRLARLLPNPTDEARRIVAPFVWLEGRVPGVEAQVEPLPGPEGTRLLRVVADLPDRTPLALSPALADVVGAEPLCFLVSRGNLLCCASDDEASAVFGHQVAWQQYREADGVSPCGYRRAGDGLAVAAWSDGILAAAALRARSNFEADQWNAQREDLAPAAAARGVVVARAFPGPDGAECSVAEKVLAEARVLLPRTSHVSVTSADDTSERLSWEAFEARFGAALGEVSTLVPPRWLLSRWV